MGKTELVFVPGMGHLLSAVELVKLIIRRDHRLSVVIFIINFPSDYNAVNAYVESQSRHADPTGRLTFVSLPTLPNPLDPAIKSIFTAFVELHKPLVTQAVLDRVQSGSPKPAGFLLDMFCITLIDVANELHVPSYLFFASGAAFLSLMLQFQSLAYNDGVDVTKVFNDPDKELDVPGFRNPVPGKLLPFGFAR